MKKLIKLSALTVLLVAVLSVGVLAWNDGVYTGTAKGHNGPILLEVKVADGKISEVNVLEHVETPYISDAGFMVTDNIIKTQSLAVDTISGATVTSKAVIAAVTEAVLVPDGTYTGVGKGFGGDITVEVTVKDRKITAINVISHSETPYLSDSALNTMPDAMIKAQSPVVDTVTGATGTSKGIISAVNDALKIQK